MKMNKDKFKSETSSGGNAPWLNTFADLMNLLLCFFVLLFAFSNVDNTKYEAIVESFTKSGINILSGGTSAIDEGNKISSGVSQINDLEEYVGGMGKEATDEQQEMLDELETEQLVESEKMAEKVQDAVTSDQLTNYVDVDFTSRYVLLTLSGALLFDSGSADLKKEAYPIVDKLGEILVTYKDCTIEIEGHTDTVPIHNSKFKNNNELSSFRALSLFDYLVEHTDLDPATIKHTGRGEYVPIADNATAEGRAKNRRVEVKIYHTLGLY